LKDNILWFCFFHDAADLDASRIIASATLLVELKFIRNCGKCGHIEDVVVDSSYRGQRLGLRVIEALIEAAKEAGCYKVILDCSEHNAAFYSKCGLEKKEIQMVRYL
jgi:glucosamine-phosphate N-acetyltransferase